MADLTDSKRDLKLNLERSRTSRAFGGDESLWTRELGRLFDLIKRHTETLDGQETTEIEEQPLLSIGIFGTYGSGKTSLLKTFTRQANNKKERPAEAKEIKVASLPIIEPNMLAQDDHFLYAFIATALEKDAKRDDRERDRSKRVDILSPVQQVFQELSEYLHVIDKSDRSQDYDPLGLSLERLDRHSSGLLLRERLQEWITVLVNELAGGSSSVLLMPVDDADMSLDNLTFTLDTYRRYLLHPRLIPVFTFTGRLAEELLRVHFARKITAGESHEISEKLSEATTSLKTTEHLAYQYLVKLFPIRNRIRLGPAPARVQAANYGFGSKQDNIEVMGLLEASSRLLFGHPNRPMAPSIRLSLRPSTLRRQLQVVDAMHDARVLDLPGDTDSGQEVGTGQSTTELVKLRIDGTKVLLKKESNGEFVPADLEDLQETEGETLLAKELWTWAHTFDVAAWSLLNVHRDVLRELTIYIEDLYSWTPMTLRRVVLESLLSRDLEERRLLIKRWRYRIEDRRSQVISLLAANAFRPQMAGEEPTGDDPELIRELQGAERIPVDDNNRYGFSMTRGFVWWLNLWMGFYLPQVLARNRHSESLVRDPVTGRVRGIGWDLRNGPINAVREALSNGEISSTGLLFVDPYEFSEHIRKPSPTSLFLRIWCLYGEELGRPWAAVSLWRGLGLMGQILQELKRKNYGGEISGRQDQESEDSLNEVIVKLITRHCESAGVPGTLNRSRLEFQKWSEDEYEYMIYKKTDNGLIILKDEVQKWLKLCRPFFIHPLSPTDSATAGVDSQRGGSEKEIEKADADTSFNSCFIRRLHGSNILGEFWTKLEKVYLERTSASNSPGEPSADLESRPELNAWMALERWCRVLEEFWKSCSARPGNEQAGSEVNHVNHMIRTCPWLAPLFTAEKTEAFFLGKEIRSFIELIERDVDPDAASEDP